MPSVMPRTPLLDIHALVKRTGIDARTIRRYAERGLIPRPDFAGKKTRYTHEHLVRLLAIRKLYETSAQLSVIQAELAKRSFAELEVLVGLAAPAEADKPVEVVAAPAPRDASATAIAPPASRGSASDFMSKGERWRKVALLPGLELMMREDATEFVRKVAREIEERYCATP
jgi:DNA-binding transcriptional MerR regulator